MLRVGMGGDPARERKRAGLPTRIEFQVGSR